MYKGTVIRESLVNFSILKDFKVLDEKKSETGKWHLYTIKVSEEDIYKLSKYLKPEKYYAHFWKGDYGLVAYRNRVYPIKYSDKTTWVEAIKHGKSIGIPEEQLDFLIDE